MDRVADLQVALDELNTKYPRPGMPALHMSERYVFQTDWPHRTWPGATQPGLYVFVNEHDELLYIGKASCTRALGHRLGHYFSGRTLDTFTIADGNAAGATCVITIPLPPDHAFEAPAVEEFLLTRVATRGNKNGARRRAVGQHGA